MTDVARSAIDAQVDQQMAVEILEMIQGVDSQFAPGERMEFKLALEKRHFPVLQEQLSLIANGEPNDDYRQLAREFNAQTGLDSFDHDRETEWGQRFDVIAEEFDELDDEVFAAVNSDRMQSYTDEHRIIEELADLVITCFTAAEVMDVDLAAAYQRKMEYNLHKTGDIVEDGKVQDDADIEKPDFFDLVPDPMESQPEAPSA